MITFRRTINKRLNGSLLMEQLNPLGIGGITWLGFVSDPTKLSHYVPRATRGEYASSTKGGVKTILEADPGEIQFNGEVDPGTALDTILANHDATGRSAEQLVEDALEVDRAVVKAAIDRPTLMTPDDIKAMARIVYDS